MREPVGLRGQRTLATVEARGSARVTGLAAELQVSVVTVRRDAEELAREGRLRRGHGVVRSTLPAQEFPARGLPGGEPDPADPPDGNAVAVVVPERHSYLYEVLHGARSVREAAGRRIALHIAPQERAPKGRWGGRALADGAAGLLPAPRRRTRADEEADRDRPAASGVPTVLMERRPRPGSALHAMDPLCSGHECGARLAVEHLVGLGHRRIVFATREDSPTTRTLRSAFARIAEEHPLVEAAAWTPSAPDAGPGDRTPPTSPTGPGACTRGCALAATPSGGTARSPRRWRSATACSPCPRPDCSSGRPGQTESSGCTVTAAAM
ncbi:DeoR family transcriptional regulator [Streptomyces sp. TE5632]